MARLAFPTRLALLVALSGGLAVPALAQDQGPAPMTAQQPKAKPAVAVKQAPGATLDLLLPRLPLTPERHRAFGSRDRLDLLTPIDFTLF